MYVVKFQGALGNQMFEYAFLKSLEKKYPDTSVKGYIGNIRDFNGYELEKVFGIKVPCVSLENYMRLSDDIPSEAKWKWILKWKYSQKKRLFGYKSSHLRQGDNSAYYPVVYELNPLKPYLFDGVWANAAYIEPFRSEILEIFRFREFSEENNIKIKERIMSENSVAIHVRRNEYVTNNLTVASDDYYKKAIEMISNAVDKPTYYVFSDDHEYCKKLFGDIEYTLIDWNKGENSYKDMQLMTYCKHNIIANSTFSFWGAYLGINDDKIVIAPKLSWGHLKHPFARESWIMLDAQ